MITIGVTWIISRNAGLEIGPGSVILMLIADTVITCNLIWAVLS